MSAPRARRPYAQVPAAHALQTIEVVPQDVTTWSDLSICTAGHQLLYRLRDEDGRLLYVGVTWNPKERWKCHRRTKPWFLAVTTARVECHESDWCAHEAEYAAILTERPAHNRHGVLAP